MNEELWDVVIVGAGAAGLSAALVLGRARRRVLVVDGGEPRNRVTNHMHGVLGHDGRNPADLLADGRREVLGYGVTIVSRQLDSLAATDEGFVLGTDLRARKALVATGAWDELPDIAGLAEHWGEGAVACPYCDGYEARDSRIAVINGVHQALMLKQWSADVTLFATDLDDDTRGQLLAREVVIDERPIERVVGARGQLEGVVVGGGLLPFDRIFVASRFHPRDELLRAVGVEVVDGQFGEMVRVEASGVTNIAGVWAAGNVSNMSALVPVAMAEGVAAATSINMALTMDEIAAAMDAGVTR
jgi:thioredoxin reductase